MTYSSIQYRTESFGHEVAEHAEQDPGYKRPWLTGCLFTIIET